MTKSSFEIGIMNIFAEHTYKIKQVIIKNETHEKLLKIAAYLGIPAGKITEIAIEAFVNEHWDYEENRPRDRRKFDD